MKKIFFSLSVLSVFFLSAGCSSQASDNEPRASQKKVDVVAIGLDKSQGASFADNYSKARLFFEADERGHKLNEKGLYADAVKEFEKALPLADSTVQKAMVYNGFFES